MSVLHYSVDLKKSYDDDDDDEHSKILSAQYVKKIKARRRSKYAGK